MIELGMTPAFFSNMELAGKSPKKSWMPGKISENHVEYGKIRAMIYWLVVEPYPSEKYEFVNWDDDIPNCFWKVIQNSMVPVTTNQSINEGVVRCEHHGMKSGEFSGKPGKLWHQRVQGFNWGPYSRPMLRPISDFPVDGCNEATHFKPIVTETYYDPLRCERFPLVA